MIYGICYAGASGPLLVTTDMESLSATRTVNDSKVIPAPSPVFSGVIGKTIDTSKAWWPPKIVAPANAPNILLIIIDDEGFGAPSTFGGMIPTPELDKIANEGLRFNNFHTTALCSPTRAALITGRNHGTVGYEMIAELSTGFPGYDAIMGKDHATIARILQANGYATAWFGKDHNVPPVQMTAAGPFDQWPTGQGFDYFYGFLGGDTDQWNPSLFENTTAIFPSQNHPGYNLNIDLADKAILWLTRVNDLKPAQPVFLYYAPGATHAPHQPTPEWIAKFKGKFHDGWNVYREATFKKQQEMGIIPKSAKLTPWPDKLLPQWDSLTAVEKQVFEKQMEVYAAYLAQTDYEVGRVVQAFKDTGRYDNTLIIYISGDNGSSTEGGLTGTPNEVQSLGNSVFLKPEQILKYLPEWGGPKTDPHFAAPWAWAMDTPFKWTKQVASYFGGTKNGMVVSWPGHISDKGGLRQQFHHVIDVVPTILEVTKIVEPEMVDGVKQDPIQGVSFAYTFDQANANSPSKHHTQYFEMFGARAIYNDGWIAATEPFGAPWLTFANKPVADPWNNATWHLYHITPDADWTENDDVKDQYPDKLKELQNLFASEAQKNNVLPLNAMPSFLDARPSLLGASKTIVYHTGIVGLSFSNTPMILNRSYRIEADVTIPASGANGVMVADGGTFGGYSLFLQNGKPHFSYNLIMLDTIRWSGKAAVSAGHHIITFDFAYDGGGYGKGGVGTLLVDGKVVDTHRIEQTVPFTMPWFEGLDIGMDMLTPVDDQYKTPFAFTGTINKVTFNLDTVKMTAQQMQVWKNVLATVAAGRE
jgi:arylsulfatase